MLNLVNKLDIRNINIEIIEEVAEVEDVVYNTVESSNAESNVYQESLLWMKQDCTDNGMTDMEDIRDYLCITTD